MEGFFSSLLFLQPKMLNKDFFSLLNLRFNWGRWGRGLILYKIIPQKYALYALPTFS